MHVRHPRYALFDLNEELLSVLPANQNAENLATKELLAKIRRDPIGMYCKQRGDGGILVCSLKGTFPLTGQYVRNHKIDTEFNAWFHTHMSEGWKPCLGQCRGSKDVCWYDVANEDPPFKKNVPPSCIGYCRRARKVQGKE